MTTPTPRWTADEQSIIDRIARHIWPSGGNGQVPTNAPEEIFEDLKRAGVLIPVGGKTRQEWCLWFRDRVWADHPNAESAREHLEQRRIGGYPNPGEIRCRAVTTYPDGTVTTGPWREVTDDPA